MDKQSIAYTATLIKYVADLTGSKLQTVTTAIGEKGLARLIHNAPMNRLLPLKRIAAEVIHDYDIRSTNAKDIEPDVCFGDAVAEQVQTAPSKWEFGTYLFTALIKE